MIFVVNEEPYNLVDFNVKQKNKEFIEGIDAEYFQYILKVHLNADESDKHRGSIALKAALHHAMETFFALLGTYVQAHDCSYAWVAKYKNSELRDFIERIHEKDNLFTKLVLDEVSWEGIASHIFQCDTSTADEQKSLAKLFAKFWRRLARYYLDQNNTDEYNSVKHGFRARAGGFSLYAGIQKSLGELSDEMSLVGACDNGVSIFKLEPVDQQKGNRSLKSKVVATNYYQEQSGLLMQLVYLSIYNLKSALKIVNKIDGDTPIFKVPEDQSIFERAWGYRPSVNNLTMEVVVENPSSFFVTREQLQAEINKYVLKSKEK